MWWYYTHAMWKYQHLIWLTPYGIMWYDMMWRQSKIEEDTPFGRVARPFFYGNDDEFRNNRFKLIPKVSYCIRFASIAQTLTLSLWHLILLHSTLWCDISSCHMISYCVLSCLMMSYSYAPHLSVMWCNVHFLFLFFSIFVIFIR